MSRIDELDMVLRQKGAKVSAGIPQLALWATAGDAHAALTALEEKRAALMAELAEAGINDLEMPGNTRSFAPASPRSDLGRFVVKALVVIGLIAGLFTLSAALLTSRLERLVQDTHELDAAVHESRRR